MSDSTCPAPRPRFTAAHALRLFVRQTLLALPFAAFFGFLLGGPLHAYWISLQASLVYTYVIGAAIPLNAYLVVPRLVPTGVPLYGRPLLVEAASFAIAGLTASVVAAAIIQVAVIHD